MRLQTLASGMLVLALGGAPLRASATRYILAPAILQTDPYPSEILPDRDLAAFQRTFEAAFDAAFPKGRRPLDKDHLLDPADPTVLVVPRLSVARIGHDSVAGALDRFEATLVGDVSLMDPWSMTRLFSATRMVTGVTEQDRSRSAEEVAAAQQQAMNEAGAAWIQACLKEIRDHAQPFTRQGAILPSQSGFSLKGGGGFWPFGSLDGVQENSHPVGPQGKTLKVRMGGLHPRFTVLEDPLKPNRTLAAGEVYQVTLIGAERPADRAEPKVAIQWVGPAPAPPSKEVNRPLDAVGWSELLANYLSKSGSYRILPLADDPVTRTPAWQQLVDNLRTFSGTTSVGLMDVTQDTVAQNILSEPCDVLVQIGMADAYHGTLPGAMATLDHRFHAEWGIRWFERDPDGEGADGPGPLLFKGVAFQPEQQLLKTKDGFRDRDLDAVWFNLCRNGLIRIAKAAADRIQVAGAHQRWIVQENGKLDTGGAVLALNARLTRRRALGTVRSGGAVLGTYFGKGEPISLKDLDRCSPGDEISSASGPVRQLVELMPVDAPPGAEALLQPEWARARVAEQIIRLKPVDLEFLDSPAGAGSKDPRYLVMKIEALTAEPRPGLLNLSATWRLRYYHGGYDPLAEPTVKAGIIQSGPFQIGQPYLPGDRGEAGLSFQQSAVPELIKRATTQGLIEALSKE